MGVRVICGSRMLRELLLEAVENSGYQTIGLAPGPDALGGVDPGEIVIVRVGEASFDESREFVRQAVRHDGIHVILICATGVIDKLHVEFGSRVSAIIPETAPLESATTAILLVSQGFRLALPQADALPPPEQPVTRRSLTPISIEHFSNREVSILTSLRDGKSNKDIAKDLGISDATVKVHLRSVFKKTNSRNRTQAALWASRHL